MLEQIWDWLNKHLLHLVLCQLELNLKGLLKIFEADFYFPLNISSSYFWSAFITWLLLHLLSLSEAQLDFEMQQDWWLSKWLPATPHPPPQPPVRLIPLIRSALCRLHRSHNHPIVNQKMFDHRCKAWFAANANVNNFWAMSCRELYWKDAIPHGRSGPTRRLYL